MDTLTNLDSDDLAQLGITISSPRALRGFLLRRPEVSAVRRALDAGDLSSEDIREFVSGLLEDLRRGVRFPHDVALSALAVALQNLPGGFAVEFLEDLSRTRIRELRSSPIVAEVCLHERDVTPSTVVELRLSSPESTGEIDIQTEARQLSFVASSDMTHRIEAA